MTVLAQDKLDVLNKERSNMFDWRGQFTPEFIEYLLSVFSKPGMVVADPFLGSGTVVLESVKKGLSCIGYELNPSAYYMSKFYEYSKLSRVEREQILFRSCSLIDSILNEYSADLPVYIKADSYRESYKSLLTIASEINLNASKSDLPFLINVLFLCEKDKKKSLIQSITDNLKVMSDNLLSLPFSKDIVEVNLGDARYIGNQYKDLVDLIITSPPYINVFNYHQNYRGIIEQFDYDVLKVAESEFGSNRKNRTNRFRTVVQYTIDMGCALYESALALKKGGKMVVIVGRVSNVRSTPFYNSKIIEDLVKVIDSLKVENTYSRHFMNRFGETIVEDILIIEKKQLETKEVSWDVFRTIGLEQIKEALKYADSSVNDELMDIINRPDIIQPSPIN